MRIYRIGDERHPLWDGTGAALIGGRWNSPGRPVIYGSLSYACAMLETLAHANIGRIPTTHRYVIADIPDGVTVERHDQSTLPLGWDAENNAAARAFGDLWLSEARSAVMLVPSVASKLEWNALINSAHPAATRLKPSAAERVVWDKRLFMRLSGSN